MNKKLKWTLIGVGALVALSVIGKIMGSGDKDEKVTVEKVALRTIVETVESVTCDINNENCYKAKTIPAIFNMSAHQGFTTGG